MNPKTTNILTKLKILSLFVIGLFWTSLNQIQAQAPFFTTINSEYVVDQNAQTQVTHQVKLENTTSSTYASEYAFEISSANIDNLKVLDTQQNNIRYYLTPSENTTNLNIEFSDRVVGKGQAQEFSITYTQTDLAQIDGQVLEVSIPKIIQIESLDNFQIKLMIDKNFSAVGDINPEPNSRSLTDQHSVLYFTDKQSVKNGIHAIFGESQIMSFSLNYHLDNPTVNNGITQITLPPDTAFQKVYYENINPKPDRIVADGDGNWIATYILKPKEQISVIAQGMVEIFLRPTVPVPTYNKNINLYLIEKPYWQVNDPEIQKLANQLKTPEAIYNYLVENFSYNYSRLDSTSGRMGAVEAIKNPDQVLCQEFTDAFVTLARAAGIPAREHNGFAYTRNQQVRPLSLVKDVLHAWPEYFDIEKQAWIQIDPTWGNTTGGMDYFTKTDLNHFTFVVHGLDSTSPYAAGYFKGSNYFDKDILVEFTEQTPQEKGELEISLKPNFLHLLGLPVPTNLYIKNQANTAFHKQEIHIDSDNWQIKWGDQSIESVLPYTDTSLPLLIQAPRFFYTNKDIITIKIDDKVYDINLQITRQDQIIFIGVLLSVAGFGSFIAFITRRILVFRRKR